MKEVLSNLIIRTCIDLIISLSMIRGYTESYIK